MYSNTHPIFFLSPGNLSLEKSKRKKLCDWLPDQGWEDIVRLMELFPNEFGTLADDIEKNPEEWKDVSGRNHQTHTRWTYGEILYITYGIWLSVSDTVVWLGCSRAGFLSNEVQGKPHSLPEASADPLLQAGQSLSCRQWLRHAYHGREVRGNWKSIMDFIKYSSSILQTDHVITRVYIFN